LKFYIVLFLLSIFYLYTNVFVWKHFTYLLPKQKKVKIFITLSTSLLAFSFILGRLIENFAPYQVSHILIVIGSIWLGFLFYLFSTFFLTDFIMLIIKLTTNQNDLTIFNGISLKYFLTFTAIAFSFAFSLAGYYNAQNTKITSLNIVINKQAGNLTKLKIIVASDLHLGHMMCNSHLKKIVNKINSLKPDIILLPGDILDEDITPVVHNNMGLELKRLKAKYGIFAVTGNHEYLGGVDEGVSYLAKNNIVFLRDSYLLINNSLYIVGREDKSSNIFKKSFFRKSLSEIINKIDKRKPIILLDHQPSNLEDAVKNNVDLQLSGHTHNGQLFPFNFLTKLIFEKSWGYLKKGDTQFYISCGVGTWGPPMKTSATSEIVEIILKFK